MHIVFFTMCLNRGGTERVITNLCNECLVKNHRVSIVTCLMEQAHYDLDKKIQHIKLDKIEENKNQHKLPRFIKRRNNFKRIIRNLQPDIIITFLPEPTFIALSLKKKLQIPVIVSERSDPFLKYNSTLYKLLIRLLYPNGDGFVFQTEGAKSFFDSKTQARSVIIPNPIASDAIHTRYEGKRKKEIVTVGRLVPEKNYTMLFYAMNEIAKEFPEYVLCIYGEGPLRQKLTVLRKELGLEEHILLMGKTDNVFEVIKKSSLFVLSSAHEGMPNSLMEAMALGLPVISTDCPSGGPRFLIKNNYNGLLVKNDNVQEMVKGIRRVLLDTDLAKRLGKNAAKIAEELTPEKVHMQWEDYICKIGRSGN